MNRYQKLSGGITALVDNEAGTLRLHRTFDSFGNIVDETHYAADPYGYAYEVTEGDPEYLDAAFAFTGRLLDQYTGLQNNLNRWYDARVGRWLSEDPIGFRGGDANLYRYVGNGPVNGTDPTGLFGFWDWWYGNGWANSRGDDLDQCIAKGNLSRGLGRDSFDFARDFRRNQLTGADNAVQDIRCLSNEYVNFVQTAALSVVPARGLDIIPNRSARAGLPLTLDDAIDEVRRGGDVIARDRDTARRIAERAGKRSTDLGSAT